MNTKRKAINYLSGVFALALTTGAANAVVIDSFQTSQSLEQSAVGSISGSVNGAGILGGQREATINVINNQNPALNRSELDIQNGGLNFNNDVLVSSELRLIYDGIDGNAGTNNFGLNGVDLTSGGLFDGFTVNYSADMDALLTFRIFEDAGNFSDYTINLIGDSAMNSAEVMFSNFTIASGAGADFGGINAMEILVNEGGAVASLDFQMNGLGNNPPQVSEGAVGLPLIAGFLGLAAYARYRRNK